MRKRTIGYIRVSTDKQTIDNQRLAILDYLQKEQGKTVDDWIEAVVSSRRTTAERRIDELIAQVKKGDTVIVAELSRLGRSVGQVIQIVDALINAGVKVVSIKEGLKLNGSKDIQSKVIITMFGLLAEIERDLISERTKEGLRRAQAAGKQLGRPKGSRSSRLDGREDEVREYLVKGLNMTAISKLLGVSRSAARHFVQSRRLAA